MGQDNYEPREEIAIIGMACRFPGASNIDEFWSNLRAGVESIQTFSDEQLDSAGVSTEARTDPRFVGTGALADDLDCFDADFFGIGRREAEIMDPQHRVFLETAWEALEGAGYEPERFDGLVGVFGGVAPNTYRNNILNTRPELLEAVGDYLTMICSEKEYAVTRTAFKLNLRGASMTVNTACSTSGVALHLACQSLLSGENDLCIVGGARVRVPLTAGYVYQDDGIPSPDGHCRAFDADARGTMIGNGAAMIVVKRLSDAIRDRDTVHAIVKSTAVNNDGSAKVGFTAPGVRGQSAVIAEAHALAEISADQIGYLEAHGTGTALGDPIEVTAATQAFRESTDRRGFCGIGSVKTNIGHLDAGAGIAGVIKATLALKHAQIPPSLNFTRPNPQIDFESSPFFVVDQLRPWERNPEDPEAPRRAGVSTFGLGGTNAHIVLEEAPTPVPRAASLRRNQLFVWSARTETGLEQATDSLARHVEDHPELDVDDISQTLQIGRRRFQERRFLVATGREDALSALAGRDPERLVTQNAGAEERLPVFLFPGAGIQAGMAGRDLYDQESVFRSALDLCLDFSARELGTELRETLYPQNDRADPPNLTTAPASVLLPLLFSLEYSLAQLWKSWGVVPVAMIGHGLGEVVAACESGVVSRNDALRIASARGRLLEKIDPIAMLGVQLPETELLEFLGTLSLAAVNLPDACVVSGSSPEIEDLQRRLEDRDVQCARIPSFTAAHSQSVEPALEELRAILSQIEFREPEIPYVSNVTGTWIRPEEALDPEYWVKQLRQTVRFSSGIETILSEGERLLIEVGPGQALTAIARQHPAHDAVGSVSLTSMREPGNQQSDDAFLLGRLGRAWLSGVDIDWESFHGGEPARRVPLPTYPFERVRHWVEPAERSTHALSDDASSRVAAGSLEASLHNALGTSSGPAQPGIPRRARILTELMQVVEQLSGLQQDEIDIHTSFIQLGFDSLLLTQANTAFRRRFPVTITFRQLLEDAPTLDHLALYIDAELPADAFPDAGAGQAGAPSAAGAPPADGALHKASGDSALAERVIAEQMRIMREQLAILRGEATTLDVAPQTIHAQSSALGSQSSNGTAQEPAPRLLGPWTPISTAADAGLTPHQQRHLDALIKRFTARTSASKTSTQANRRSLSDPRAVAGFKREWKELVYPIVAERASGSRLWDLDGNEWIDITMGFGVTLFGHSPPFISDALREQLDLSMAIGPQTPLAGEVAALVCELTGLERAGFCNTGSEAVLAAVRAARTVTERDRIVVFANDYHGMFDEVLARAVGQGENARVLPVAPGIPASAVEQVIVLEYGAPESLEIIAARADEIAAILVEPIQSRNPELQPRDFIHALRDLTAARDIALIFDEMITGFRLAQGGAQAFYGVQADIATYGKVIGGGMPIGVVAGSARYLDALDGGDWQFGDASAPEVGVTWFAGTFVRHPLTLAAARAALLRLKEAGPQLQAELNEKTAAFVGEMNDWYAAGEYPVRLRTFSSLFIFEFSEECEHAALFFHYLRDLNVHCHERRPHFLTTAHTADDIAQLTAALRTAAEHMREAHFFPMPGEAGAPDEKTVPMTDAQIEIWLAAQVDDDASRAFHISATLELKGALDQTALYCAFDRLLARHDSLRARISSSGTAQFISESLHVAPREHDLSGLRDQQQADQLREIQRREDETLFDLKHGPLIRFTVVRLAENSHRIIIAAHHLVCDGWSLGVVIRDLGALYQSERSGDPLQHHPAPSQFGDYAASQLRRKQGEEGAASERYWCSQFEGTLPVLDLPTDRPRPEIKTYPGAEESISLGGDFLRDLKTAATRNESTLFAMLVATYAVFLKRITNADDTVIGVATAGQPGAGAKDLVGHCVSLYPLRARTDRSEPFAAHLSEIKLSLLESLEYPDFTFGTLLQKLSIPRDTGRLPLMSTLVTYETETTGLEFGDLQIHFSNNQKSYCNFELELYLTETSNDLRVEFHYNRDLFDSATIQRWLNHLHTLLRAVANDETGPSASLPFLDAESEHQLLVEWNETAHPHAEQRGIHQSFEQRAAERPDSVAIVCPANADSTETVLTYSELNARANRLARRLQRSGLEAGHLVAICLERTPDLHVAMLAVWKAGAAYVPMDPSFPAERLEQMLVDSEATSIVTTREIVQRLEPGQAHVCCLEESENGAGSDADADASNDADAENLNLEVPQDALAYVIYTSGSTGLPKGVEIPHFAVVNFLTSMARTPGFTASDRLLAVTTFSFDIALLELFLPLSVGGQVVLAASADVYDGRRLAHLIEEHDITVMQATPATWRLMLDDGWRGSNSLRALCGGEAVPAELADTLATCCEVLFNMYGPTETTIWSTLAKVEPGARPISIGRPIDNTQIYILDKLGAPVPIGAPGELCIGGDGLAHGYRGQPELTEDRFSENRFASDPSGKNGKPRLYRTGDLARYRADGQIECLGRLDSQVKLRGFRIELGEIEAVLEQGKEIDQAVVAVWGQDSDKRLVAYFKSANPLDPADLRERLRQRLPEYMVPAAYVRLDALPLTPNGKIDRKRLPEPTLETAVGHADDTKPNGEIEIKIAKIWCELLQLDTVGVHTPFFDIGGHSLLATRLATRLRQSFAVDVSLRTVFEAPTISDLAGRIGPSIVSPTVPAPDPTTTPSDDDDDELELLI